MNNLPPTTTEVKPHDSTFGDYEAKLQALRDKWKEATVSTREILIRQARAIQIAIEKREKKLQRQIEINL